MSSVYRCEGRRLRALECRLASPMCGTKPKYHRPLQWKILQLFRSEQLYAPHVVDPDEKVDLRQVVNESLPAPPTEVKIQTHWLAVDGIGTEAAPTTVPTGSSEEPEDAVLVQQLHSYYLVKVIF